MAVGDLKGAEAIVIEVTSGAAIAVGDVVHIEADGFWDPVVDTDVGKFGVALDVATAAAETIRVCIYGRVEVTATAAAIANGELVMSGTTGKVAAADATGAGLGEVLGTAMEAIGTSGTGTVFVGLVG